jgi:hypothetical protein
VPPQCRDAITVLAVIHEPSVFSSAVRATLVRLGEMRDELITAPEQRVADEALALVKGLLEEQ